ncbi:uncharacterized protein LOC132205232 isoform X2 [Neocloeon triangulifer]|uniref:uncharacterized protein LOC132205232 isoform X2 n=1 Tax=Neocloeon triangulifer TaxID=2078957 RepID=UPI00286FA131|nr:uncharacterized protein LOC132205232 isoform X2 [Neocloeon triangulifer]
MAKVFNTLSVLILLAIAPGLQTLDCKDFFNKCFACYEDQICYCSSLDKRVNLDCNKLKGSSIGYLEILQHDGSGLRCPLKNVVVNKTICLEATASCKNTTDVTISYENTSSAFNLASCPQTSVFPSFKSTLQDAVGSLDLGQLCHYFLRIYKRYSKRNETMQNQLTNSCVDALEQIKSFRSNLIAMIDKYECSSGKKECNCENGNSMLKHSELFIMCFVFVMVTVLAILDGFQTRKLKKISNAIQNIVKEINRNDFVAKKSQDVNLEETSFNAECNDIELYETVKTTDENNESNGQKEVYDYLYTRGRYCAQSSNEEYVNI